MGKYILKRVLQFIPVFLGVTLILFVMENVVPGDPIKLIAGEKKLDPVTEQNLRVSFHLIETDSDGNVIYDANGNTIETPLWKRYVLYINGLLHGDLGVSYQKAGQSVSDIIVSKYPYTVRLALVAIVLEAVLGIGAGMISGDKTLFLLGYSRDAAVGALRIDAGVLVGHAPSAILRNIPQERHGRCVLSAHIWRRLVPTATFPGWVYYIIARLHAGCHLHGVYRPNHALAAPRGPQPGLHSHRQGQGPLQA